MTRRDKMTINTLLDMKRRGEKIVMLTAYDYQTAVIEDRKRGLVARLDRSAPVEDAAVAAILGQFNTPWEWDT